MNGLGTKMINISQGCQKLQMCFLYLHKLIKIKLSRLMVPVSLFLFCIVLIFVK